MKFKILDKKSEKNSTCFLLRSSLENYISHIPNNYDDYEIQRSIVNNSYLDRLVYTVLNKGHIPSITLITDESAESIENGYVRDFKILDGLQRTHRLKVIFETKNLFLEKKAYITSDISDFQIKRMFRNELSEIGSSGNIFIAIKDYYEKHGGDELNSCFVDNYQWFEIWSGLSPDDEVRKMLVLNAGHKPVNIKHQLELLFQNLLPIFEGVKSGDVRIVREKNISSAEFSKTREVGIYHFSHLISSLISYIECKPISTNTNFISKIQDDETKLDELSTLFTYSFLELFIQSIYKLDKAADECFNDIGVQWIGREVSLVSVFAALGKKSKTEQDLSFLINSLCANFQKLNLEDYERCRNNVDLSKVNIGNVNKKNIYDALSDFLESNMDNPIDWDRVFSGVFE
ncbi:MULTISPECIES: hypothetical protein [Aeromonas]|uniref:hypothetical protein n=1 Tax=Aeromonas TaxID=642 RepID=UPI003528C416